MRHLARHEVYSDCCRLEDDPALDNAQLRRKLEANRVIAKSRVDEVINKYAEKQDRQEYSDCSDSEEENEADVSQESMPVVLEDVEADGDGDAAVGDELPPVDPKGCGSQPLDSPDDDAPAHAPADVLVPADESDDEDGNDISLIMSSVCTAHAQKSPRKDSPVPTVLPQGNTDNASNSGAKLETAKTVPPTERVRSTTPDPVEQDDVVTCTPVAVRGSPKFVCPASDTPSTSRTVCECERPPSPSAATTSTPKQNRNKLKLNKPKTPRRVQLICECKSTTSKVFLLQCLNLMLCSSVQVSPTVPRNRPKS